MKITWFSNRTFRVHLGGQIVVIEPDEAPRRVDRTELTSGANRVVLFGERVEGIAGADWKPRPPERLLDAGDTIRVPEIWSAGDGTILLDADDERPLLVVASDVPPLGRWAIGSVVVLAGEALASRAGAVLERAAPRLIALAGPEREVDMAFAALGDRLDGVGLIALEPGLAMEA